MRKTALVTGGSSGLGFALSKQLQSQGYDLILIARDYDKLCAAKQKLNLLCESTQIALYSCDLLDEDNMLKTFNEIYAKGTKIDFLVLNAGIVSINLLQDYGSLGEITRNIKINLLGAISSTYLSLPMLKADSHILLVSSGFGMIGPAGYSLYAAAKAGIINFAEALRRELTSKKIRVHVTCPGDIDTPMLQTELKIMPNWIKEKMGRAKPQNADYVATYVLKKCFKGQFMVIPSLDVKFLVLVNKLLPRVLYTFLGDRVLPLPPKNS